MFFVAKKEESQAINLFKKNCTYHGLEVQLSLRALNALKTAAEAKLAGVPPDIDSRNENTLMRRGLVRYATADGELIITELGILVIALAEAGGLVSLKGAK
jgi:hypothetical protein